MQARFIATHRSTPMEKRETRRARCAEGSLGFCAARLLKQRRASLCAPCERCFAGAVAGGISLQEAARPAACIELASPMDPSGCHSAGLALRWFEERFTLDRVPRF